MRVKRAVGTDPMTGRRNDFCTESRCTALKIVSQTKLTREPLPTFAVGRKKMKIAVAGGSLTRMVRARRRSRRNAVTLYSGRWFRSERGPSQLDPRPSGHVTADGDGRRCGYLLSSDKNRCSTGAVLKYIGLPGGFFFFVSRQRNGRECLSVISGGSEKKPRNFPRQSHLLFIYFSTFAAAVKHAAFRRRATGRLMIIKWFHPKKAPGYVIKIRKYRAQLTLIIQ